MNLQKVLAENMIRFGVKNLNAQSYKTLLNEGVKPGGAVDELPELELNYVGEASTSIKQKLAKYPGQTLYSAALVAIGAGFANIAARTKGLRGNVAQLGPTYYEGIIGFLSPYFDNLGAQSVNSNMYGDSPKANAKAVEALIQSCNFTYEKKDVSVYPGPRGGVATLGTTGGSTVENLGRQKGSNYESLINYLNRFNIGNILTGDFTQYNLSSMLDSNNYVDLLNAGIAANSVIVYTKSIYAPGQANKEIGTTTQGATAPIDKDYDVSFNGGDATVPPNDAEVTRAVADAIAMFPDGNISNLSIVSSASPEFNSKQGGPATLADYGTTPVTGTGQPTVGNDNIGKNIKLAYNRGVNFIAAINAGLVAQGKPEIQGYNIKWQISDKDGTKVPGRYAKVLWSKAGTPGKDVINLDNTGKAGTVTSGRETYTIYQHIFTAVS